MYSHYDDIGAYNSKESPYFLGINLSIGPMNTILGGVLSFCRRLLKRTRDIGIIFAAKTEF